MRGRAVCCLLLLGVACGGSGGPTPPLRNPSSPSPPATPAESGAAGRTPVAATKLPEQRDATVPCGNFTVAWENPNGPGEHHATIKVTDAGGREVMSESETSYEGMIVFTPVWCHDVLGDGGTVLVFDKYSGGAHCCTTVTVVELADPPRTLLKQDLGNAGGVDLAEYDDRPLELDSFSDVFAYFDDLSYAASPFLPLVFRYDGTRFVEATRQFPDRIRADRDDALARMRKAAAVSSPDAVEIEGPALEAYADGLLLGVDDVEAIKKDVPSEVGRWLDAHAKAVRDTVRKGFA